MSVYLVLKTVPGPVVSEAKPAPGLPEVVTQQTTQLNTPLHLCP